MNRRPNQSLSEYDAFSAKTASRFTASTPGNDFFDTHRKKPLPVQIALFFFFLIFVLLLVNFAANRFVHVSRITVPVTGLTEAFDGYTLLHISDLKGASFGSSQGLLRFALRQSDFDAVVFTGDMLSRHDNAQPFYRLIECLRTLNPDAPIYFIAGDDDPDIVSTEYFSGGSAFAPWVLGAQQRGAQLLAAPQAITRGEQSVWLMAGSHLSLDMDTMRSQFELQYLKALDTHDDNAIELAGHNLSWLTQTQDARKAITPQDAVITLTHTPPTDDMLSSEVYRGVDLVLCGHALGGLIRLPLLGPVFIPSPSLPNYGLFPGSDVQYGLTRTGGIRLYVSPGLGSVNEDYPPFFFRLFNPPTVTLISLTPSSI